MRKHSGYLERAHEAEARHIGRRHRRDVPSIVKDLTCRRTEKLGQQIEARGLDGPVRANQRINAATPNLERNIANGKKPRELLVQSVALENELIGQSNRTHQPPS